MSAPASARVVLSPLSQLATAERAKVIGVVADQMPPAEAVAVLTALAGTRDETAALPWAIQRRVQELLLRAFPPGLNAIIVSRLGIALVPTEDWLPEIEDHLNTGNVDDAIATLKRWAGEPPGEA